MPHGRRVRPGSGSASAKLTRKPVYCRFAELTGGTLGTAEARWENEGGAVDEDGPSGRSASAFPTDAVLNAAGYLHSGGLHRHRG